MTRKEVTITKTNKIKGLDTFRQENELLRTRA
jgi:hypothetical protein